MHKFYKWFLVSVAVVLLTACGGGSSSVESAQPTAQTVAIDKIMLYADDNNQPVPTIVDYSNAGILGVAAENIDDLNAVVASLSAMDVDNSEKIQALLDDLGIVLPDDITPPVITLNGANPMTIIQGNTYTEPGATAVDDVDGTVSITTSGSVDTSTIGTYTITYSAEDSAGNTVSETRTVNVVRESIPDETPPVITLKGANPMTIIQGNTYAEPGATAVDDVDGTVSITTSGSVDTSTIGTYTITYSAEDSAGNTVSETRTVNVTAVPTTSLQWNFLPSVVQGTQFDAQVGPNNLIHLITERYYQLNLAGEIIVNENQGDEQQGMFWFPPAIAVGDDGSVHIVTRDAGDVKTGVDIRYRRRDSAGNWDVNYIFGNRVPRNYVVGISWNDTEVIMSSTDGSAVNSTVLYGDILFWKAQESSASYLGLWRDKWRPDVDTRMRGQNNKIYLGSGIHAAHASTIFYSQANTGAELVSSTPEIHTAGTGRKSFPDIALDVQNNAHFVYGTESEVYYNKYNASGEKIFANDKRIFANLGTWHLSTGLSAVAVSESGQIVVAVALRAKGDDLAENSDVLWSYSTDGGVSWSNVQDTGKDSDAGEGRRRPRLVDLGDSFVLLYGDSTVSGISMGVLTFK